LRVKVPSAAAPSRKCASHINNAASCAPTIDPFHLFLSRHENILGQLGGQLGVFVLFSSFAIALSASAGSRCK
jgi:hypothetical protein